MDLSLICGFWTAFCFLLVLTLVSGAGYFIWLLVKEKTPLNKGFGKILSACLMLSAASIVFGAADKGPNELMRVQQKVTLLEKDYPTVVEIMSNEEGANTQELSFINQYLDLYESALETLSQNRGSISGLLFRSVIIPEYNITSSDIQKFALPSDTILVKTPEAESGEGEVSHG